MDYWVIFFMVKLKPARYQKPSRSVVQRKSSVFSRRTRSRASQTHHLKPLTSRRSNPSRKKNTLWLTILSGIVGIIFILGIALFILYKSLLSAAVDQAQNQLLVLVPTEVADADDSVVLAYVGKDLKDSYVVAVPGKTDVVVPGGYGHYRLSAVYPLLQLEKKENDYVTASFSRITNQLIDGVYSTPEISLSDETSRAKLQQSLGTVIMQKLLQTHQPPFELIKLWALLKQGLEVKQVTGLPELQNYLSQKKAVTNAAQQCPIGVLNGSAQIGAAQTIGELFEHSGLVTIRTASFPNQQDKTVMYNAGKPECQPVVELVKRAFIAPPQVITDENMTTQYRAPIVVVLGNDFQ